MAQGTLSGAVGQLRGVVGRQSARLESDAELLNRFVSRRDEAAFELLVYRYERMVRGVCRRVLPGAEDADDAWQATFLTLARKAGRVVNRESLAGWLYRVAYRIALRVKVDAARRRRHEREAGGANPAPGGANPLHEAGRRDLRAIVGEEIDRLPEKYRLPVVLCYLEGKTNEEAALLLGCPTGTVVTWLARTRARLRTRLERRGVALTAGTLAAVVSLPEPCSALSPSLRSATVKAALAFADGKAAPGLIPPRVTALTRGAFHAMLVNRSKLIAAVLATLCLGGIGSGVLASRSPESPEGQAPGRPEAPGPQGVRPPDAEQRNLNDKLGTNAAANEQGAAAGPQEKEKDKKKQAKTDRQKAEEVVAQTFKTGKSPAVTLETFNGKIEVVADSDGAVAAKLTKRSEAETEAEAKERLKGIEVTLRQDKDQKQDTVKITARRNEDKRPSHDRVDAEVRVPPGAVLDLRTSNGPVNVTGGTGSVTILTSNGPILVKDGKGELKLNTTNGKITVTGATGRVDVKTSNGAIDVQAEKGLVTAKTSNGAVHFSGTLADGEHKLTTSNGGIRVSLPGDARFRVEASTSHGSVASEFTPAPANPKDRQHLKATVGKDPTVSLGLHTSNGSIEISKKKE
jgi:RNA polymerase sigma factor (sigma-70 family)